MIKKFPCFAFILLTFATLSLFGGSLRLYNNSPYKLRAVVRGSDGSYLGEMVMLPAQNATWSADYPNFSAGGYTENPTRSLTPYSVHWFCVDGDEYGVCSNMATGGAVIAGTSEGSKMCKPPKKKPSVYGAHPDDEQLQNSIIP